MHLYMVKFADGKTIAQTALNAESILDAVISAADIFPCYGELIEVKKL